MSSVPDACDELLASADRLLAANEPRAAVTLYQRVLHDHPGHVGAWCRLGQALWSLGEHGLAQQTVEVALRVDPDALEALARLGEMHRDRLDFAGERRCHARMVAAIERRVGRGEPVTAALAQTYASALVAVGAGEAALDVLRRLDEAVPAGNLWLLQIEALERLGEYERMLALYRSQLERRRPLEARRGPIFLDSGWDFPSSLGDLGARIGTFALLQQEGVYPGRRGVVRAGGAIANPTYLDYWTHHVDVVRDAAATAGDVHDTNAVLLPDGTCRYVFHAFAALNARRIAAGRSPLLALRPDHVARGEEALARLGLPPEKWFVALHVRHGGYKRDHTDHRKVHVNSDVMTYLPAIAAIVARGGCVIRIGDPAMPPLPALDGVIDLATHPAKSDWLDVYCLARCLFLLGTGSGPVQVAATFGVPVAVANLFPVTMTASSPVDIVWPKLLRRRDDGRLVPFADLFQPPLLEQSFADTLDRLGIDVVDNEPEEIVALVAEMFERVRGTWRETTPDEALQARYKALAPTPAVEQVGRMCTAFLRKHAALLPPIPARPTRQDLPGGAR